MQILEREKDVNYIIPNSNYNWCLERAIFDEEKIAEAPTWLSTVKQEFEIRKETVDVDVSLFTKEQKMVYDLVTSHSSKQILLLIIGTAGTGKSFMIHALSNTLKNSIKVTATTGVASFNINGQTLSSLLKLPVRNNNKKPLQGDALAHLQKTLKCVKFIVIDEYTMLGCETFYWVDQRLKQASGKLDEPFGGFSIILVGDTCQLPPVGDSPLYKPKHKHDSLAGHMLYKLFNTVCKLTQIKRQEGNDLNQQKFRDLLLRMRLYDSTNEDVKYLQERSPQNITVKHNHNFIAQFREKSLHLFPTKEKVNNFNMERLFNLKDGNNNTMPIAKIEARNTCKNNSFGADDFCGLTNEVYLARGAKVMLMINLWVEAGLVNGAKGTIVRVVYHDGSQPPDLPIFVLVQFDNYIGPSFISDISKTVPIIPVTLRDDSGVHERTQLPICLSWAISIHKSQGSTLESACIDIGKKDFALGLSFVALSRIKSLQNSIIEFIPYKRLVNVKKSKALLQREMEEKRLNELCKLFTMSLYEE